MNYYFAVYAGSGKGLSGEVDDIVTYIIVTGDDETSVATSGRKMHGKGLQATVTFLLKVRGVDVITST